jgi:hypothetical protein
VREDAKVLEAKPLIGGEKHSHPVKEVADLNGFTEKC